MWVERKSQNPLWYWYCVVILSCPFNTVKPVTRGHLNKCPYMTGVPSSQVNVKVHFGSQKMQFRHPNKCPLITGFTAQLSLYIYLFWYKVTRFDRSFGLGCVFRENSFFIKKLNLLILVLYLWAIMLFIWLIFTSESVSVFNEHCT